ncbi:Prolyl 4-hydroxylase subunit alpha-2 [Manis javanica]|nr:Prolyl 4-hydroxylase subunit alpha-2 [Manis javanica]
MTVFCFCTMLEFRNLEAGNPGALLCTIEPSIWSWTEKRDALKLMIPDDMEDLGKLVDVYKVLKYLNKDWSLEESYVLQDPSTGPFQGGPARGVLIMWPPGSPMPCVFPPASSGGIQLFCERESGSIPLPPGAREIREHGSRHTQRHGRM